MRTRRAHPRVGNSMALPRTLLRSPPFRDGDVNHSIFSITIHIMSKLLFIFYVLALLSPLHIMYFWLIKKSHGAVWTTLDQVGCIDHILVHSKNDENRKQNGKTFLERKRMESRRMNRRKNFSLNFNPVVAGPRIPHQCSHTFTQKWFLHEFAFYFKWNLIVSHQGIVWLQHVRITKPQKAFIRPRNTQHRHCLQIKHSSPMHKYRHTISISMVRFEILITASLSTFAQSILFCGL